MTTMISNLPNVLIEEIFARVPLKFLRAVKLTCKSWNTLSTSESFTKMYIGKAATREEESMMIAKMNNDLYLMRVVDGDDVDPYIVCKRRPSFLDEQVKIARVFHCEGLLLCIFKDDNSNAVVWNPYLGQMRLIKHRYSHRPHGWDRFSYALGYEDNESCHSVKFLRFIDYWSNGPEKQFFWYEIYDFDSGLWKTLDITPQWCIMFGDHGVSLKGNTYWPAQGRNSKDEFVDHIICFDFTRERFGPLLPLPSSVRYLEYECVSLSYFREEKLAALFQHDESNDYELEIWITTKIDVEMVSWSKFLNIDTRPVIRTHICEGFIIEEVKKVFMGFNEDYPNTLSIIGQAGDSRKLDLGVYVDPNCRPYVSSYVPSLVQIKELARGKRKRESRLEKRRFDQYKLRLAGFDKNNNW